MKKTPVLALILALTAANFSFSAVSTAVSATPVASPTIETSKMSIIQQKVQQELDQISRDGKAGQNVDKEIIVDKYGKKPKPEEPAAVATPAGYDMGTLAAMNVIGGLFEGGIVGASCGLIGYSKSMNSDVKPLVVGTVTGAFTGAGLGAVLSLVQTTTKRYSSSDDLGYDIAGGTVLGTVLGAAGGVISYGKTRHLENVSEGMGYGVAFGAGLGLTLGIIESLLPEYYRGSTDKLRAINIYGTQGGTMLSCNLQF